MPCDKRGAVSDATFKAKRFCIFTVKVPPGRRDLLCGDCTKLGGASLSLDPPYDSLTIDEHQNSIGGGPKQAKKISDFDIFRGMRT